MPERQSMTKTGGKDTKGKRAVTSTRRWTAYPVDPFQTKADIDEFKQLWDEAEKKEKAKKS